MRPRQITIRDISPRRVRLGGLIEHEQHAAISSYVAILTGQVTWEQNRLASRSSEQAARARRRLLWFMGRSSSQAVPAGGKKPSPPQVQPMPQPAAGDESPPSESPPTEPPLTVSPPAAPWSAARYELSRENPTEVPDGELPPWHEASYELGREAIPLSPVERLRLLARLGVILPGTSPLALDLVLQLLQLQTALALLQEQGYAGPGYVDGYGVAHWGVIGHTVTPTHVIVSVFTAGSQVSFGFYPRGSPWGGPGQVLGDQKQDPWVTEVGSYFDNIETIYTIIEAVVVWDAADYNAATNNCRSFKEAVVGLGDAGTEAVTPATNVFTEYMTLLEGWVLDALIPR